MAKLGYDFQAPWVLQCYSDAIARSNASIWHTAMAREKLSLEQMGAFEEVDLPEGQCAIGLKWVYAHKSDSDDANIQGKEKARLVAQGLNQWPGQYNDTYALVAKMTSVCVLLAWAAVHDLDIYQFDCKTAFLHAKIHHPIYAQQIPGYPLSNLMKVLHILVALYGLHQSAFRFYNLFSSLLLTLGPRRWWDGNPEPDVGSGRSHQGRDFFFDLHIT